MTEDLFTCGAVGACHLFEPVGGAANRMLASFSTGAVPGGTRRTLTLSRH